jgi:hypothetical protein
MDAVSPSAASSLFLTAKGTVEIRGGRENYARVMTESRVLFCAHVVGAVDQQWTIEIVPERAKSACGPPTHVGE